MHFMTKKFWKRFGFIYLSLLIPTVGWAENLPSDLTEAQIREAFDGFKVVKGGADPDATVTLYGTFPASCIDKFKFEPTARESHIQSTHSVGFRIHDKGGGLNCIKTEKNTSPKAHLSKLLNPLKLKELPSGLKIGLFKDSDVDLAPDDERIFEEFSEKIIYKNKETFEKEAAAAKAEIVNQVEKEKRKKEQQKKQVDKWLKDLNHCNGAPEQVGLAREALTGLRGLEDAAEILGDYLKIDPDKKEKELEKKALEYALKEFEKRVDSVSLEELEDLRAEVADWIASYSDVPGLPDKVAKRIFIKIANRYVAGNLGKNPANWEATKAVMQSALQIEGLSNANRAVIENALRSDLPLLKQGALASQGLAGNFLFWPNQMNLMNQLQANAWAACNPGGQSSQRGLFGNSSPAGTDSNLESCAAAMSALQTGAAFPEQAQAVDQQRAQFAQQMQNAMQNAARKSQGEEINTKGSTGQPKNFITNLPNQAENKIESQTNGTQISPFMAPAYAGGVYGQVNSSRF